MGPTTSKVVTTTLDPSLGKGKGIAHEMSKKEKENLEAGYFERFKQLNYLSMHREKIAKGVDMGDIL